MRKLTVAARLYRSFNVADALNGDAILIVAVYELVLEFSDFVDEHTKFVCDVRDIIVASLAPNR